LIFYCGVKNATYEWTLGLVECALKQRADC
jgi:hypothetical protein